jgi:hypothetical protein
LAAVALSPIRKLESPESSQSVFHGSAVSIGEPSGVSRIIAANSCSGSSGLAGGSGDPTPVTIQVFLPQTSGREATASCRFISTPSAIKSRSFELTICAAFEGRSLPFYYPDILSMRRTCALQYSRYGASLGFSTHS